MNKTLYRSIIFILILSAIAFAIAVSIRLNASMTGSEMGRISGINSGKLAGSIDGLSEAKEAWEEGKQKGLSAEDIVVNLSNSLSQTEKLEVLVASVKVSDLREVGEKYKALYLIGGEVIVTVDLSQSTIEYNSENSEWIICLPEPEAELRMDQDKIEKKASYSKRFLNGSAKDGMEAFYNSMRELSETSVEELSNHDYLIEAAKDSARKQVAELICATMISENDVKIVFDSDEEGD